VSTTARHWFLPEADEPTALLDVQIFQGTSQHLYINTSSHTFVNFVQIFCMRVLYRPSATRSTHLIFCDLIIAVLDPGYMLMFMFRYIIQHKFGRSHPDVFIGIITIRKFPSNTTSLLYIIDWLHVSTLWGHH